MSYFTSTDESDMESQGSDYSFSKRHRKGRKYGQVIDGKPTLYIKNNKNFLAI